MKHVHGPRIKKKKRNENPKNLLAMLESLYTILNIYLSFIGNFKKG